MLRTVRKAFTLVEILIVVVILGVLAAIVTAGMLNSVNDAKINTAANELGKIRRAIEVYLARNNNQLPPITAGDATWGPIVGTGDYLKSAPRNPYAGDGAATVIIFAAGPDAAYQTTHGWIFDNTTGEVWAGNFDANGEPIPAP